MVTHILVGGRQVDLNYRPPEVVPGKRKRWHHRIPGTWGFCFEPITGSWRNRCSMIFHFFLLTNWMNRTFYKFYLYVALASLITKKDSKNGIWTFLLSLSMTPSTTSKLKISSTWQITTAVGFSFQLIGFLPFFEKIDHFRAWKEFHAASFWVRHIWINIGDLPLCLFQTVHHFDYRLVEGEPLFLGNCAKFRKVCSTSLETKQLLHSEKRHLQASLNQHMTDYPKYPPISCLF